MKFLGVLVFSGFSSHAKGESWVSWFFHHWPLLQQILTRYHLAKGQFGRKFRGCPGFSYDGNSSSAAFNVLLTQVLPQPLPDQMFRDRFEP
jgi:hypothetical protein